MRSMLHPLLNLFRRPPQSLWLPAVLLIQIALIPGGAHAGTVTEIINFSGNGTYLLIAPQAVALAPDGTRYAASQATFGNVFRITPTGVIDQIIDVYADGTHFLNGPMDLALDAAGNLYVPGYFSDNVFKVTPSGVITQIIDSSGDGLGHVLTGAKGVAVDSNGNVYVGGFQSDNVFKVTPSGSISQVLDSFGGGFGLNGPEDLATDGAGNLYVAGNLSNNVLRISPAGAVSRILSAAGDSAGHPLANPSSLDADAAGTVVVAGSSSHNVFRIAGGTITQILDAAGNGISSLNSPSGVSIDAFGNVWVTGLGSDNVFRISPSGTILRVVDVTGDGQGASLQQPAAVTTNAAGVALVAASASSNVFEIAMGQLTIDSFLNYRSRMNRSSPPAPAPSAIGTTDAFGTQNVLVRRTNAIAAPADLNGSGVFDANTSLMQYSIIPFPDERYLPVSGIRVQNALGGLSLDMLRESYLLLPASVDLTNPVSTPPFTGHGLDYLKCYRVRVTSGTPRLASGMQRDVADPLTPVGFRRFDIRKPASLCLPAQLDFGAGPNAIKNADNAMVCYRAKLARNYIENGPGGQGALTPRDHGTRFVPAQPQHTRINALYTADALASLRMDTTKERSLCIPSFVELP